MTELVEQQQSSSNPVTDETGQFDPRFVLWRKFCGDHGVPVGTLPGDLGPEVKKLWEQAKQRELGPK